MVNIILKFDDFDAIASTLKQKVLNNFIQKEKIKVSWGIIGKKIKSLSLKEIDEIKKAKLSGLYSFFNHGYTHEMNEFKNLSLDEQIEHINKTQLIVKELLDIDLNAFGAPCNAINDFTIAALEANKDIKIWFFGNDQYSSINIPRELNLEIPIFHPNYVEFKKQFASFNGDFLCLQCHPNSWNWMDLYRFIKIIKYLKLLRCNFIFPEEYKSHR